MADFEGKGEKLAAASLALAGALLSGEAPAAEGQIATEPVPITHAHNPNLAEAGLPKFTLSEDFLDVRAEPELYTVKPGDSLSRIAKTLLHDAKAWELLAQINKIKDPNRIQVGQELLLPSEQQLSVWKGEQGPVKEKQLITYQVKSGDTLSEIAEELLGSAKKWRVLADFNGLKEPYIIHPGDKLKVPRTIKEETIQQYPRQERSPKASEGVEKSLAEKVEQYRPFLVHGRGRAYRESQIKSHSHYREEISSDINQMCGRSRIWGDASLETQATVVSQMIDHLEQEGFSKSEICYAIALCRVESGFNPDAAAGTTSASGIGQFIDSTRAELCSRAGIQNTNPFCMTVNLHCLSESLKESFRFARARVKAGDDEALYRMAYAYHHDGPTLQYGGARIADRDVLPRMAIIRTALSTDESSPTGQ